MSISQVLGPALLVANLGNSVNPAVLPKEVNPHTDTNSNSITRVVTSQLQIPSKFKQAQVELQPQAEVSIIACIKDPEQEAFFDNLLRRIGVGLDTIKEAFSKFRDNDIIARLNLPLDAPFICSEGTPKVGTVVIQRRQSI
jgi:hypothetical protein